MHSDSQTDSIIITYKQQNKNNGGGGGGGTIQLGRQKLLVPFLPLPSVTASVIGINPGPNCTSLAQIPQMQASTSYSCLQLKMCRLQQCRVVDSRNSAATVEAKEQLLSLPRMDKLSLLSFACFLCLSNSSVRLGGPGHTYVQRGAKNRAREG